MTGQTGGGATNVTRGHVVKRQVNRQVLVGVTWQTVGRIGTGCDGVDDFLTRAVMTGATGAGTVSRNIVGGAFDLGPGGCRVTVATRLTRSVERQVARSFSNRMTMAGMQGVEAGGVTGGAVPCSTLTNRTADQGAVSSIVTACTAIMGIKCCTDQGVIVTTGTAGRSYSDQCCVIRRR